MLATEPLGSLTSPAFENETERMSRKAPGQQARMPDPQMPFTQTSVTVPARKFKAFLNHISLGERT